MNIIWRSVSRTVPIITSDRTLTSFVANDFFPSERYRPSRGASRNGGRDAAGGGVFSPFSVGASTQRRAREIGARSREPRWSHVTDCGAVHVLHHSVLGHRANILALVVARNCFPQRIYTTRNTPPCCLLALSLVPAPPRSSALCCPQRALVVVRVDQRRHHSRHQQQTIHARASQ